MVNQQFVISAQPTAKLKVMWTMVLIAHQAVLRVGDRPCNHPLSKKQRIVMPETQQQGHLHTARELWQLCTLMKNTVFWHHNDAIDQAAKDQTTRNAVGHDSDLHGSAISFAAFH